jgi:hypothetical protein
MAEPFLYKITVFFRPGQPGSQAEVTQRLCAELQQAFASRAEQVAVNTSPFSRPPGVFNIDVFVRDKALVWELNRWVIEQARPHVPDSFVAMEAAADGASVAVARWVPLESNWYSAERGKENRRFANAHPIRCTACKWPDFDAPPEPFFVDGSVASAGKNEFLPASNGVFVASARVLQILSTHAGADFHSGPVVSRAKPLPEEFFWVRPRRRIGARVGQQAVGTPCAACGMPERFSMEGVSGSSPYASIVEQFGDAAWNLALVGDFPLGESPRDPERGVTFFVTVSGGLFAVLWNQGVKGLQWPKQGPYISKRPAEKTWEEHRRFADVFPSAKDKAAKYTASIAPAT